MSMRLGVRSFCAVVSVFGALAFLLVVVGNGAPFVRDHLATFLVLTAGVLFSELLPLKIPRRGEDEELTVSSAFAFALLLVGGVGPALLAQAFASVVQDVHARKQLWRTAFNVGQYTLAMVAAWLVMHQVSGVPHLDAERPFSNVEFPVVLLGAIVFFVVNATIVGTAIALHQGTSPRRYLADDWVFSVMTSGVLLSLAPMIVAATRFSLMIPPLFAMPVTALFRAGRESARSEHAARHDSLTQLANRGRFHVVAEATLEADAGAPVAVLLMDLDRFKDVNDSLGHHHGDLMLQAVAARLRDQVPEAVIIARLGGDEFALLLGSDAAADAVGTAERISSALHEPIAIGAFVMEGEASIGIAVSPEDGSDVETLLQRADVAMYRAKSTHAAWARYEEEHDHHSPAKLALMADLRVAIDSGEIVVWYQPILDLPSETVHSAEALVRWQHPELGLLPPGAFLEMAEHTSLIKPLTHRVLEDAMRQADVWRRQGLDLGVAVNISMRSLLDPEFPEQVAALLARTGVPARLVKLEITEGTMMADPIVARSVLDQLNLLGVSLSIDDFGTGYSSLAYLKDLPVDEVKIDRSFVMNMGPESTSGDAVIVRSTIDLGHHLGLKVVAEGIEDEATLERLRDLRCDRAQGYWICRPQPAAEVTAWALQQRTRRALHTEAPALRILDGAPA